MEEGPCSLHRVAPLRSLNTGASPRLQATSFRFAENPGARDVPDESEDSLQKQGAYSALATSEETEFSDPLFRFSPS